MKRMVANGSVFVTVVLVLAVPALGQRAEQTFQLVEGWNSIFLEVNAAPSSADELFAGLPITSVWGRVPEPALVVDPDCAGPDDPDCQPPHDTLWRVWLPPGPAAPAVTSLRVIRGNRVYLVQTTEAMELTIRGVPGGPPQRWRQGFTLGGFFVTSDPQATPTFAEYLGPGFLGGEIVYQVDPDGGLTPLPTSARITPGRGVWVTSAQDIRYEGPLQIDQNTTRGIDFGKRQRTHSIELTNLGDSIRQVALEYLPAIVPEAGGSDGLPAHAGDVPLHWLDYGGGDQVANMLQWSPLVAHTVSVPPHDSIASATRLQVGVRRVGLAGAVLDVNFEGSQYQGLLEITDGAGFRRVVGVAAEAFPPAGGPGVSGDTPRPGLYLGIVTVDRVAWVTAGARVWTNDVPNNPQFAGHMKCFGGDDEGDACFEEQRMCRGTAEVELMHVVCETVDDCCVAVDDCDECPACLDGTDIVCDTPAVPPCPGGTCNAFCLDNPDVPCADSGDCPAEDACSASLDKTIARPTPHKFEFPVIIHLDDNNEYRMLTEVTVLKDDEDRLVLATPDCDPELCDDDLRGALIVNGEPFARRVSTAAFAFEHDLVMEGGFGSFLSGTTILTRDNPLNPFRHGFHPDHDCVDADGNPVDGECFEVTRAIIFAFEDEPPEGQSTLDWGDSIVGGVYTENVEGLHREAIKAQGRFELRRVSNIGLLNTPVGGSELR